MYARLAMYIHLNNILNAKAECIFIHRYCRESFAEKRLYVMFTNEREAISSCSVSSTKMTVNVWHLGARAMQWRKLCCCALAKEAKKRGKNVSLLSSSLPLFPLSLSAHLAFLSRLQVKHVSNSRNRVLFRLKTKPYLRRKVKLNTAPQKPDNRLRELAPQP